MPFRYNRLAKSDSIDTVTNQGDENVDADTSEEIAYIHPDDVEWDFIERLEDDHLINICWWVRIDVRVRVVNDRIP